MLVVGGGFAGLEAARRLAGAPVTVTLLDGRNHHLFQPLLYQVATAALAPGSIATPIRRVLRDQANARVLLGRAVAVDLARRVVRTEQGELSYDWLVLAAGATHSYFGHEEWRRQAPGLKTIDDAVEMRRRVLLAFEEAELEGDEASRRAKLTFVIVGGGPTGVELAGALKEIAARSIPRDFRFIDTTTTRVVLLEGGDRLLGAMPAACGERARRDLERLGVEVRLSAMVTGIDEEGVAIGEERLAAENVFWAAGVEGSPLARTLGVDLDGGGRVPVAPDLSLPGHPEVFVVGDLAHAPDPATGEPVPGVAPAARQMGRHAARCIRASVERGVAPDARPAFRYRDKGSMATVGRARAVAAIGRFTFGGLFAWLLWSVVHIYFLIGFRRRLVVMLNWMWSYLAWSKGSRLITGDPRVEVRRPRDATRS